MPPSTKVFLTFAIGTVPRSRQYQLPGQMSLRPRQSASGLALTRLEAAVRLVDDVRSAATADDTAIPMASLQGLQRIANLHGRAPARVSCLVVGIGSLKSRRPT